MVRISTILLLIIFASNVKSFGQYNTINTSVPFLGISPSTRSASMADIGVATGVDPSSAYWNPGKLIMTDDYAGITVSHAPWMQSLHKGLSLTSVYAFIDPTESEEQKQILAASFRYFSRGDLKYTDANGNEVGTFRPSDFAADFTYSRQIGERMGVGLTFRVISSSLGSSQIYSDLSKVNPGMAFAFDLGFYKSIILGSNETDNLSFGASLQNVGSKIRYSDAGTGTFLPTNIKIGSAYTLGNDPEANIFTLGIEFNKLLVPTPPLYGENEEIIKGKNSNVGVFQGIGQSFTDAPGGLKEELKEVQASIGGECAFNDIYFLRAGLSLENKYKGYRNYASIGAGYKLRLSANKVAFDAGYLLPLDKSSPLRNSIRVSISLLIDK